MGKDEFVGTWKLVSFEARRSDGQIVYPFGRDVIGVISYDAKGNMSMQMMRSDRPAFAISDFQKGAPEEILVKNALTQPHRTVINPLDDQTRILGQALRDSIKQELLKSV